MVALYRCGRHAEALRVFAEGRRVLEIARQAERECAGAARVVLVTRFRHHRRFERCDERLGDSELADRPSEGGGLEQRTRDGVAA